MFDKDLCLSKWCVLYKYLLMERLLAIYHVYIEYGNVTSVSFLNKISLGGHP